MRRRVGIGAGVVALLAAVALAASTVSFLQGSPPGDQIRGRNAPELTGLHGWVNSTPLTIGGLRGRVVLIDFWTFSCINCVRTFPHLRALYARYHAFGLEIVGVHSPEFTFEKDRQKVADAVRRHRLPYPVALDNEMDTWRAYLNRYWPHVYLIDARGRIRFDHIGEGGEDEIQEHVRALLSETGVRLPEPVELRETGPSAHITPEIYAGTLRGGPFLGNAEGYRSHAVDYAPVGRAGLDRAGAGGTFFLQGRWLARDEFVEAEVDGARVVLPFFARDVFFVAEARRGARVDLLVDDRPIPVDARGTDAPEGFVEVERSDLFRAVRLPRPERHVLTLVVPRGFRLYTFTFG